MPSADLQLQLYVVERKILEESHNLIWTQLKLMRIRRREKLKLSLKRIIGLMSTCQAQPEFEAYALDLINLYSHSFSQGELERGRS